MGGPFYGKIADIVVIFSQLSFSLGYLYFISGQLQQICCIKYGMCYDKGYFIIMLIIPAMLVTQITSYYYFYYISIFSMSSMAIGFVTLIAYCSSLLYDKVQLSDANAFADINYFDPI